MKKNPLGDIEEEMKKTREKSKKKEGDNIIYTSFVNFSSGNLIEQVYDDKEKTSKFCIWNREKGIVDYANEIDTGETIYRPIFAEEVVKKAILLPSKTEEYGSDEKLDESIKVFINKWLDIPDDILQFGLWNIKRSWVYERFHTLNYLRALGDTGTGKSRFLDTLGYIHYKPINTSGATTSAPVFRIIDKWKGTLIMDEADFQKSDEAQDIIKIINVGYEKGKYVMRCDKNNPKQIDFFDPYCPKILATRKSFQDKATEGRCITYVMSGTERKDIPPNLNNDFFAETLSLRNKLLLWRFRNYHKINPKLEIDFDYGELEPRVKQIVTSFVNLFGNNKQQLNNFKIFINNHQEELIEERRNTFAGSVVGAIYELLQDGLLDINAEDIISKGDLKDWKGNPSKPRGLTSILKSLGFGKSKPRRVGDEIKRCIPLKEKHLKGLFKRYGYDVTVVTMLTVTPISQVSNNNNKIEEQRGDSNNRNNSNTVTEEIEDNPLKFDSKFIVYHKCSIENCQEYETNPDSEGKHFCKDHWEKYAKK